MAAPQSKYGGIPVEDAPTQSKYGGIPVDDTAPTTSTGGSAEEPHSVLGFGKNVLSSGAKFLGNVGSALVHPIDTMQGMGDIAAGGFSKLGVHPPGKPLPEEANFDALVNDYKNAYGSLGKAGETLYHDPLRVASDVSTVAGAGGGMLKSGARAAQAAGLPSVASAAGKVGQVASTVGDVANPMTMPLKGAATAMRGVLAKPLVRSALGIPKIEERFGGDPAGAILDHTSSTRPSEIAKQAQSVVRDTTRDRNALINASTADTHLAPARKVVGGRIDEAKAMNSTETPRELQPMMNYLEKPEPSFAGKTDYPAGANTPISFQATPTGILGPNGAPIMKQQLVRGAPPEPVISETQTPKTLLGMRQRFGKDYSSFNPARLKSSEGTEIANRTYGELSEELHRAVPGTKAQDMLIHSLSAAIPRASKAEFAAGPVESSVNRLTRPTGGAFPLLFGLHEGGLPGAMAVMAGQEMLNSPVGKMVGARTFSGAARGLGSPLLRRAIPQAVTSRRGQ